MFFDGFVSLVMIRSSLTVTVKECPLNNLAGVEKKQNSAETQRKHKESCVFLCVLSASVVVSSRTDGWPNLENAMQREEQSRLEMVSKQIASRGIKDRPVLEAMRSVERHRFVSSEFHDEAYADYPLPIGHAQTISQPYIVALMTSLLEVDSGSRVLEIGTGSGYQTAVLAELVAEVYSVEIIPALATAATEQLAMLGYTNVHVRQDDGHRGWPDASPFDGILVAAAPREVPSGLTDQLMLGGRLVIPVGDYFQDLLVITRTKKGLKKRNVTAVRFVPMTGGNAFDS